MGKAALLKNCQLCYAIWCFLWHRCLHLVGLAAQEGRAACRTLSEELTEIRFPAPRIDPCIQIGELSSSIFSLSVDTSTQSLFIPQLRTLTTKQRTKLKILHFDDPSVSGCVVWKYFHLFSHEASGRVNRRTGGSVAVSVVVLESMASNASCDWTAWLGSFDSYPWRAWKLIGYKSHNTDNQTLINRGSY